MPWSQGCVLLVVFGGRKTSLIFWSPRTFGCAGQLSMIMATLRCWFWNFLSSLVIQFVKISDVIQAFLFEVYCVGSVFTFLKHLGFADLPITRIGIFSVPDILAQTITVNVSLLRLPPLQSRPLNSSVFSGKSLKNKPVSSALKILSAVNSVRRFLSSSVQLARAALFVSTDLASPQIFFNVMLWRSLKRSSQPLLHLKSGWSIYFCQFLRFCCQ